MVYQIQRMGRLPPYPDLRDFTPKDAVRAIQQDPKISEEVKEKIHEDFQNTLRAEPRELQADNSAYLPPVRNQGNLGSCVSFASACMLEFLHKKLYQRNISFSQLFIYKMGRDMAGFTGDSGLWLKHGIGELVRFGAPESNRYPYDISKFDEFPPSHIYSYADDFRVENGKYFRLDSPKINQTEHLDYIKKWISEKWPVITGFYCFDSLNLQRTSDTGEIPFPRNGESVIGGHAIFLYGYDDDKVITNPNNNQSTKGAFKLRNSWGTSWGINGNGFLPYAYLTDLRYGQPLADEFYSITSGTWLNLQDFE